MRRRRFASLFWCTALGLLFAFAAPAAGQEDAAPSADKPVSGRLPAYYGEVVSETQKKSIYKIQAGFDEQLEALEARYKQLSAELDKLRDEIDSIRHKERSAVEAVLTPKQLAQVKRLRAEAQARLAQELLKAAEEAARRAEELAAPQ